MTKDIDEPQLVEEWLQCRLAIYREAPDIHARLGVTEDQAEHVGGIGVARIATAGRLFWLDPHGAAAVVMAVWASEPPSRVRMVANPILQDLLAFTPAWPERWWLRTGAGEFLGLWNLWAALDDGTALQPHETPLAMLKSGGKGFVPLDLLEAPAWDRKAA
jgi:hypothetical protein